MDDCGEDDGAEMVLSQRDVAVHISKDGAYGEID